jgi:glycosyltransferase involved in cell wall biosynthesis
MSLSGPIVSVIIPLYNAEKYISETLKSVLNQTYQNFEIIVVNDGSSDRGPEICQAFAQSHPDLQIRIISQANRGLPGARNTGIRSAKGEYLALLDSDDLWHPRKLESHIQHLQRSPLVGISFSYSEFIDEANHPLGLYQNTARLTKITPEYILCRNPVGNGSTAVMRRSSMNDIRFSKDLEGQSEDYYFDEELRAKSADATDVEFWLRFCLTTNWHLEGIPEVLTYYRINSGGLSANALHQLHALDRVIEKTRTYAPKMIANCESLARAYHFRYTARRMVTMGDGNMAVEMLHQALRSNWRILLEEPNKTLVTTIAVYCIRYLPRNLYRLMEGFAMNLISKPSRITSKGHPS